MLIPNKHPFSNNYDTCMKVDCGIQLFIIADFKQRNGTNIEVINTRTLDGVQDRFRGSVDVLICNPPYVATEHVETGSRDIAAAWAGGCEGMEVTTHLKLKISTQRICRICILSRICSFGPDPQISRIPRCF